MIEIAKVTLAIPHLAEVATVYQGWLSDDDLIWSFLGLSRFYQGQVSLRSQLLRLLLYETLRERFAGNDCKYFCLST
ncbi:hypothetical protein [Nostoc sp.]|uniref:hypothetical protein n=1 Tax=Nostoc sp. TaxID=1180 RepID=UPI002FFAA7A3